jgi:regulatory protein
MFPQKKHLQPKRPLTPDEMLAKMENFCAYRERCPKEVQSKLREIGAVGDVAKQIFISLKEDNFFDEQRFAVAYARGKFRNNNWGKVRIRLELRMRDIAPDIVQQALEAIEEEVYEALIQQLLQKKLAQYEGSERPREKAAASLIRAGFEPELVFKELNQR